VVLGVELAEPLNPGPAGIEVVETGMMLGIVHRNGTALVAILGAASCRGNTYALAIFADYCECEKAVVGVAERGCGGLVAAAV
jgi:hypothetical protein